LFQPGGANPPLFHDVAFVEKHFAGVEEDLEQLNIRLDCKRFT
jgi:hypothetical protein